MSPSCFSAGDRQPLHRESSGLRHALTIRNFRAGVESLPQGLKAFPCYPESASAEAPAYHLEQFRCQQGDICHAATKLL